MKKKLIVLGAGLLAMGSVFATELSASPIMQAEVAVSVQDIDLADLNYEKADVNALPDAIKQAVVKLEESGATIQEISVAKTAEEVKVFRVTLSRNDETNLVYLDESGQVLLQTVAKIEKSEEQE